MQPQSFPSSAEFNISSRLRDLRPCSKLAAEAETAAVPGNCDDVTLQRICTWPYKFFEPCSFLDAIAREPNAAPEESMLSSEDGLRLLLDDSDSRDGKSKLG